jgi:guanylate kinase
MLYVVSGPSGCGKSTLIGRALRKLPQVRFSVSHTTRPKRPGEVDGREYHFVSPGTFETMVRDGRFLEWAAVHGHLYGTSRAEIESVPAGVDIVLDIDVQGARQIRAGSWEAVFVFVMPPVFPELRRRLEARGTEAPAEIATRLRNARREILAYGEFDYVVINDDLAAAAAELESILLGGRFRAVNRDEEIRKILQSFAEEEAGK